MTTSTNSSSPFMNGSAGKSFTEEKEKDTENFSIRTMQDDLLDLQKKGASMEKTLPKEAPKKIDPVPFLPAKEPKKVFDPKEASAEVILPFAEKRGAPEKNKDEDKLVEVPFPEKKKTTISSNAIILYVAVGLMVIAIVLGGYYFLFGRTKKEVAAPQTKPVPQQIEPQPVTEEPVPEPEKYSSEKPNYLSLDIANTSAEEIKKRISDIAEEIKTVSEKQPPYEFLVVDTNNNPVAFPIFATAAKLNLSPIILKNLAEPFSLFLYNDNGNERLSLVVNIKDKKALASELLKQEKTLLTDASLLFLNEKPEITKGAFQDNIHKNIPIRFFNVNKEITLSIDYAIVNDKLVISASKNTIRSIIDKLITEGSALSGQKPADDTTPNKTADLAPKTKKVPPVK